jgi:hypothetical protein
MLGLEASRMDKKQRKVVAHLIVQIILSIPCQHCFEHAIMYLQKYGTPEEACTNDGCALALFSWTFQFHNWVNNHLGKPSIPFESALEYYSNAKDDEYKCSNCS